jgi:hypothetical protein
MKTVLTLDSRNRINGGVPNVSKFHLDTSLNITELELTNFTFANFLNNVQTSSNVMSIGGVTAATITPGFYTATAFVLALNTALQAFYVTVADVVTLDATTNVLTWVLPSGSVDTKLLSTMNRVLGLNGGETGSFTSLLLLVGPLQLAITSPELSRFSYNTNGTTFAILGIIPVNSAHLQVQYQEPFRDWSLKFRPVCTCNELTIEVRDNRTGLFAENMGEWCCTFVTTSPF